MYPTWSKPYNLKGTPGDYGLSKDQLVTLTVNKTKGEVRFKAKTFDLYQEGLPTDKDFYIGVDLDWKYKTVSMKLTKCW